MTSKTTILLLTVVTTLICGVCKAQALPEGYWSLEQAREGLSKARAVVLDPDTRSQLEGRSIHVIQFESLLNEGSKIG
mgnify:CR=1 FL=1